MPQAIATTAWALWSFRSAFNQLVREGETFRPVAKRRTRTCRTAMVRRARFSHHASSTGQVRDLADAEQNASRAARRAKFLRHDCCRPKTSLDWSNYRRRRGECL